MTKEKKFLSTFQVPVSLGELIDKITILEIKTKYMDKEKLTNVEKELASLKLVLANIKIDIDIDLLLSLKAVNVKLWEIEDEIRKKEIKKEFDREFIQLARSVYIENDKRASIKKEINIKYKSKLIEEKLYK